MIGARETLAQRWARLAPHVQVHGPPGRRPAVLLFHGCGGIRPQMRDYAEAAAALGVRAIVVDSYAPRGWSRAFAMSTVCTGALFWGRERAGDVLAAAWGAGRDLDYDPDRLALAGFSHGAWSIMDLMTMPLERAGEAGLQDPDPAPLVGVRGLFLAYAYAGAGVLSRTRPWLWSPRVLAVLAERDHVSSPRDSARVYNRVRDVCGDRLTLWRCDAAHAFDELDTPLTGLRYDADLAAEALRRFSAHLQDTLLGA